MEKRANDLISIAITFLKIPKMHPSDGKAGVIVCKFLYVLLLCYANLVILLAVMNRGDVISLINTIESLSIYFQSISKIPTTLRKKDLLRLIDTSQFWDDPNDKFINALYSLSIKFLTIYTCILFTASSVTLSLPFFTEYEGLSFYIPPIKYADTILALIQAVHMFLNIFYVIGVDMLFTSSCINLIGQLHILGKVMSRLDWSKATFKKDFKKCVQHHCFLLDYLEHMQNIYSKVLFVQYLISMYSICLAMIKLAQNETSFSFKLRCLMIIVTISMQLAGYIFSAYYVTTMAENIGEAIYSSKWYETCPKNQKLLELIIMRTQKPFIFHGLGIFMMTRESFLGIYKSAVSLYTFLSQMKDE